MSEPSYRIADILHEKAGQYELTIFHRDAIAWLEGQLFEKRGHPYLKCLASGRDSSTSATFRIVGLSNGLRYRCSPHEPGKCGDRQ